MSEPYAAGPSDVAPSQEDRTWALAAHVGALVTAWFAFGFLAPLFVLLVKDGSPFVRRHAAESLNFQISLLIYIVVGAILGFLLTLVTFGVALLIIVPVVAVVALAALAFVLLATYRASDGEDYRYPFTIRFVR